VDFPSYLSSITFIKNLEYRTATLTQVMVIVVKVQSMILFTMYNIFNQSTNVGYLALKVFTDNITGIYRSKNYLSYSLSFDRDSNSRFTAFETNLR
jgi:hypothetical protein